MRIRNIIFFVIIIFFKINNFSFANIDNKIVVKIENEIITNFEIKNKILSLLIISNQEINQKNIDVLKGKALKSLIDLKLKRLELKNFDIKEDYKQINTYLNQVSANNINSLKEKFKQNQVNYNLFIEELKTEFRWQKFIYTVYSNKIEIDDSSIENELKNLIKNKILIKEYELSEIEISFEENAKDTNKKIKKILENISIEGFEKTALNYSISSTANNKGYLGWIKDKTLNKEILNEIRRLKIGQVTQPLKRQNTVLFLKLNNIRDIRSDEVDRDSLKNDLINSKKNDLFNLYSKSHISKLKNTSFIEYK